MLSFSAIVRGGREARVTDDRKDHAGPLILLVDDVEDNREIYAQHLRFHGFRIDEAENGQTAISRAIAYRPAVIVMDLSMPRMDGLEACRRLKSDAATRDIPIIVLTGHAYAGNREEALAAGCDVFLIKPCLPDALQAEIERRLGIEPPAPPERRRSR
jgi:CheY-like chemotaxis protein